MDVMGEGGFSQLDIQIASVVYHRPRIYLLPLGHKLQETYYDEKRDREIFSLFMIP